MQHGVLATRILIISLLSLTLAAACGSSNGASHAAAATAPTTNASTSTSAPDPDQTPNSIPYVVGEQIGLPHGWLATVTAVHLRYQAPGLPPLGAGRQYGAIDLRLENQGSATHTVDANSLFTLVDTSHKEHFVVAEPGKPNGIDGVYAPNVTRTGQLVFAAPTKEDLGLILYGPRIGTQVSYFTIVPPTVPNDAGN